MSNTKKFWLIVVAVLIVIIGVLAISLPSYSKSRLLTAKLTLQITPATSDVTVDGQLVDAGKVVKVRPGNTYVTVSKPGFASQSQHVQTKAGQTGYVGIALASNATSTVNWYAEHPADAKLFEGISSRNFDTSSDAAVAQQPILKLLPFTAAGQEYTIDYGASPTGKTDQAIYITANTDEAKQDALTWIKSQGYYPPAMEIIYQTSPDVGTPTNNSNTSM